MTSFTIRREKVCIHAAYLVFFQVEVQGVDNFKLYWVSVGYINKDGLIVADNRNAASHIVVCFILGVGVYSHCQKLKYLTIRHMFSESGHSISLGHPKEIEHQ
jgi:hypothetical protein